MLIKPILSIIQSEIQNNGYFKLQNFAGLPAEDFCNLISNEIKDLNNPLVMKISDKVPLQLNQYTVTLCAH